MPTRSAAPGRIHSMDQFRGYSVAGMFVVNFVGGFAAVHGVLKHHNTYFSLADSIMPSFLFAAGFSYRLTMLRRLREDASSAPYWHAVWRSLALILVSAALFGFDARFPPWNEMTPVVVLEFVAEVLKARLWNVLAIIGVAQLLLLPVVAEPARLRVVTALVFLVLHGVLSYSFNYEFVYGRENWMNEYWGAATARAWDGGFFGVLMWAVPMLAGTLAYDVVAAGPDVATRFRHLLACGVLLMAVGYGVSCLTRVYDGTTGASPVVPPWGQARMQTWRDYLAEPPLVPPPAARPLNYWMMDKRAMTPSFTLFSTGFALTAYALFVAACDGAGLAVGVFRVLGMNPLAAYVLHYAVLRTMTKLVPADAPLGWCLAALAAFLAVVLSFVYYLDRHRLYLRL